MHEPVTEHIEAYLAGSDKLPDQFTAHLAACLACRQELAQLKLQSQLLQLLKPPADLDPHPGFYARVVERIDSQRETSIWSLFLEPAFGRRLALASATLAVLMGLYLFSSEPSRITPDNVSGGPTIILPGEDEVAPVFGAGREQDRGVILVDLATYRE